MLEEYDHLIILSVYSELFCSSKFLFERVYNIATYFSWHIRPKLFDKILIWEHLASWIFFLILFKLYHESQLLLEALFFIHHFAI